MQRMIADLLDFSKAQAGTFNLEKVPVSVQSVVFEALEAVNLKTREKSIQFTVEIPTGTSDVFGDHRRLVQVLWNLLGNSIKFTPCGGTIHVVASQAESFTKFSVKDSGPSLAPAEIPKVFDRFWQSAKTSELGTGLGLAITKGIVEAHQGKIWVESTASMTKACTTILVATSFN